MSTKIRHDPEGCRKNREQHSLEELAQYGDQWVAWSADGCRVVTHHEDPLRTTEMVEATGPSMEDVVMEWIPPGGEVETLL